MRRRGGAEGGVPADNGTPVEFGPPIFCVGEIVECECGGCIGKGAVIPIGCWGVAGEEDGGQGFTAAEGIGFEVLHASGDDNGRQGGTIREGAVTDVRDAIGNGDGGQGGAAIEGLVSIMYV